MLRLLLNLDVVTIENEAFRSSSTTVANFTFTYVYKYIIIIKKRANVFYTFYV